MNPIDKFLEGVPRICDKDTRYAADAYFFVRESLDCTVKQLGRNKSARWRHVTGKELMDGMRQHALHEFGPMVRTVLKTWGVETTRDFGNIVFNLVNAGLLGRTDDDKVEDFDNGYSFDDAFVTPFLPRGKPSPRNSVRRRGGRSSLGRNTKKT